MSGTNDFSFDVRWTFLINTRYRCWGCDRNHANCLHHIFGRGTKYGKEESSALNVAPMNNHGCHLPQHGYWKSDKGKRMLMMKTIDYLAETGYQLNAIDNNFLEKYKREIWRLKIYTPD